MVTKHTQGRQIQDRSVSRRRRIYGSVVPEKYTIVRRLGDTLG